MKKLSSTLLIIITFIYSSDIQIKAKILDTNNKPLENVNIYYNNQGTASDNNGYFILKCDENDKIVISHINFRTVEILASKIPNNIYLINNDLNIEEVKIYGGLNNSNYHSTEIIPNIDLILKGKSHFQDIFTMISNFNYAGATSRPRYLQIRGLGELSQFAGEGPPHFYVGYILDDIDFSGIGMIGMLHDIKQVEVFKGPQSSVYGPNSMAGLINIVSNDPNQKKSISNSFTLENYNGFIFSTSLNMPITKKLSSRFTIIQSHSDGYINNSYKNSNSTNSKNETLFRTKFLFKPNHSTKIKLTTYRTVLNNKYDVWAPDNNGFATFTPSESLWLGSTRSIWVGRLARRPEC